MRIPDHLTCLLRYLHATQEATVRTGHGITNCFKIRKGVRQGCILSPCLFNLYAEFCSSSVAQSYPTLCDPMDCSTPVHHQFLEFTQTYVHWVSDTIQPSHPLLSPSPPAFIFPSIRVFSNESILSNRWPNYWSFTFSINPSYEY